MAYQYHPTINITPITPSFPSFPWKLFFPSYTYLYVTSPSPCLYFNYGYTPHPPNPYSSYSTFHYSYYYNNSYQFQNPTNNSSIFGHKYQTHFSHRRNLEKHLKVFHTNSQIRKRNQRSRLVSSNFTRSRSQSLLHRSRSGQIRPDSIRSKLTPYSFTAPDEFLKSLGVIRKLDKDGYKEGFGNYRVVKSALGFNAASRKTQLTDESVTSSPPLNPYDFNTHVPPVILRNIMENPAWYTQYTPYQAEISQSRLESLLNFQIMITDLTGFPMSNALLLDDGTADAEAMFMCNNIHKGKKKTFIIASNYHPQTIDICQTKADGFELKVVVKDRKDIYAPEVFEELPVRDVVILLLDQLNQVVVVATDCNSCSHVYDSSSNKKHVSTNGTVFALYFILLHNLDEFIANDKQLTTAHKPGTVPSPLLSGSLSNALCYIQRAFHSRAIHCLEFHDVANFMIPPKLPDPCFWLNNATTTYGPEAVSWIIQSSSKNGVYSNPTYQYDQHSQPPRRIVQECQSVSSVSGNTSNLGAATAPQDYNAYTSYANSSNQYGYGSSTRYSDFYNSYQQQQPNHAYSQSVGAYQNTGAPYQPFSSFQSTGSYAGSTTYSSTYYNPADYQTTGGYQNNNGYTNQAPMWNNGSYSSYFSHPYTSYAPYSNSSYNCGAAATSVRYQQQYTQWPDYYNQTEVSCAPGTENLTVPSSSTLGCPVPAATSGYATPNNQPPQSYPQFWGQESSTPAVPSFQPAAVNSGDYDSYWKHGAQTSSQIHQTSSQIVQTNPVQPNYQSHLDLNSSYDKFQDQQKTVTSQGTNLYYLLPPPYLSHKFHGVVATLHMVHYFHLDGFPKDLISCMTCKGSDIGDFLTIHIGVNCISFTGGTNGIAISKKFEMIPLQMELGATDACIIIEAASLDLVDANIVTGGFSYICQRCRTVKVALAMESFGDTLVKKINNKVKKLTIGSPEDDCYITLVITKPSSNFVKGLVMLNKKKEHLEFSSKVDKPLVIKKEQLRVMEVTIEICSVLCTFAEGNAKTIILNCESLLFKQWDPGKYLYSNNNFRTLRIRFK